MAGNCEQVKRKRTGLEKWDLKGQEKEKNRTRKWDLK
tara:strand:- start:2403 stop:2513 length:111 start_codon:yes stop_codon:yes gene_type:complete